MVTPPIISLTTDFGLNDPFVGVMKGVIAGICPSANVIDVTHTVPAFDILGGALAIWQAWRYFPAQTVHGVVVDPGVGSSRQAVLARLGDAWFIAPDNGVLTLVEREMRRDGGAIQCWQITNPKYMLPKQSNTFHGRDIFAPASAHLAAQIEQGTAVPETFGPAVAHLVQLPLPEPVHNQDGSIEGIILKSDTFGNLLTNLAMEDLPNDLRNYSLEIGGLRISRFYRFFAEGAPDEIFAMIGSTGMLEIVMNLESARDKTGIEPGTKFLLRSK